ncbi:HAD-IIB family hydrolase [Rothia sp. SD9660Na]|uniref:HAD-IIB family hydrolase n=1 Tax=Rothia sp. SD9660Na TaxID=3047030 RepID=UPI0024B91007|nr:HAD-IIB family hydrolase [Rothia sp. SD9660Na]WHS50589.1 HAD-IIB family hydrolase [Rothia sp. SD9660Na]
MIKLIASDLDGTLIGSDFRFRPRTLRALHAAADAGVRIVFVTGRPLRWMAPVLEQLGEEWNGENSFAFCSNGAVTFDIARSQVAATRTMSGSEVRALHADIEEVFPGALYIAETLEHVYVQGTYDPHAQEDTSKVVEGRLEEILAPDAEVVKYLLFRDGAVPADLLARVQEIVGERASATRSAPYQPLVEIAQRGLNKGRVLADFAVSLGIGPDEVAAFGDMPNDYEMLDWAGHGYVMASGLPELKDRVGRICPGFEEDGVAQIIERMLAEREGRQA